MIAFARIEIKNVYVYMEVLHIFNYVCFKGNTECKRIFNVYRIEIWPIFDTHSLDVNFYNFYYFVVNGI